MRSETRGGSITLGVNEGEIWDGDNQEWVRDAGEERRGEGTNTGQERTKPYAHEKLTLATVV